jgi:hypothetical protein
MEWEPGACGYFKGYTHLLAGMEPRFFPGDLLGVAEVQPEGVLVCFLVDHWGRCFSAAGDTVFAEEVLRLGWVRIPLRRFPVPFGSSDNEGCKPTVPIPKVLRWEGQSFS